MKTSDKEYQVRGTLCCGYIVEPVNPPTHLKLPGIVLYTDFWGINTRQMKVAEKWAQLTNSVVFVADMYGHRRTGKDFADSASLMQNLTADPLLYQERALSALDILYKHPLVNTQCIFTLGFCFGGATALQVARWTDGLLKGAISVHGLLETNVRAPSTKKMPKILVLTGARDPMVPEKDIHALQVELKACHTDYTIVTLGLCTHAFTNTEAADDEKTAYNYIGDKRTDAIIHSFLRESF